jgi:hypothetical protein
MVDPSRLKPGDYVRVLKDWKHEDKESPYFLRYIMKKGLRAGELVRVYAIMGNIRYDEADIRNYLDYEDVELVPSYQRPKGIGNLVLMSLVTGTLLAGVTQMQDLLHDPLVQKAITGLVALIAALIGGNLTLWSVKNVIASFGAIGDRHREIKQAKWEQQQRVNEQKRKDEEEDQRIRDERNTRIAKRELELERERDNHQAKLAAQQDANNKQNLAEMIRLVAATIKPATEGIPRGQRVAFIESTHPEAYYYDGTGTRRPRRGDTVTIDSANRQAGTFSYYSNGTMYTGNLSEVAFVS